MCLWVLLYAHTVYVLWHCEGPDTDTDKQRCCVLNKQQYADFIRITQIFCPWRHPVFTMLQYTVYSMCRIFVLDLLIISQAVFTLGLIGWSEPEVISYNISTLHYLAPNCDTFASPAADVCRWRYNSSEGEGAKMESNIHLICCSHILVPLIFTSRF